MCDKVDAVPDNTCSILNYKSRCDRIIVPVLPGEPIVRIEGHFYIIISTDIFVRIPRANNNAFIFLLENHNYR